MTSPDGDRIYVCHTWTAVPIHTPVCLIHAPPTPAHAHSVMCVFERCARGELGWTVTRTCRDRHVHDTAHIQRCKKKRWRMRGCHDVCAYVCDVSCMQSWCAIRCMQWRTCTLALLHGRLYYLACAACACRFHLAAHVCLGADIQRAMVMCCSALHGICSSSAHIAS